jgi:TolB-like protein/Tfp pilus assembly protein PilF
VEERLEKVLSSSMFHGSRRRRDLLKWSVERVLAGDESPVKEHQIGIEVFGKAESWDPRVDPVVRVEFNRLRQKLREYYDSDDGKDELVVIEFPPRSYVPIFRQRTPAAASEIPAIEVAETAADSPAVPPVPPQTIAPARASRRLFWPVLGAMAVGAVWAGTALWRSAAFSPPILSVAVLPFAQTAPGGGDDYLGYGFAGEITGKLTSGTALRVAASATAAPFRSRQKDVRPIGAALQVGAVVKGTISRTGSGVHVTVQVDRASDGAQLWAGSYDREMKDVVRLENQVANSVATALKAKFELPKEPEEPVALNGSLHDEYLRGVYEIQKSTPESLQRAREIFERIVSKAPRFPPPYMLLGRVHLDLAAFGAAKEEMTNAKTSLERAVELDPAAGQAYADLAYVNYVLDWNWDMAETHFRQAISLGSSANVQVMYGFGLMTRGRFAEADTHFRAAIERDPLNDVTRLNYMSVLNEEGRSDEAVKQVQFCLDRNPHWFLAELFAGYTAIYRHRPEEALASLAQAGKQAPGNSLVLAATAAAWAELGRTAEAEALVQRIERGGPGYTRYLLAMVEGLEGNSDRVFYWLEQSAELREQQALYIKVEPLLEPYRNDPRMIALERRIGLS